MKIGNLVRCQSQPTVSRVFRDHCIPLEHTIKGEVGVYINHRDECSGVVLFPQFGYEHTLAWSVLRVICESR